jgi:RNA polymerase sigma factor (sigma-70 family)
MAPPPFDLALQLRQHGSAVRRLAMELLRDGAAADDAAQETWVRAVQHPPRHEDAVGGWLATIVHNVARKLRRSERRRLRREAVAAQLRASEVEDHSTAMAREELVHRLVTAVTSLDAPFREAIWQRYFEGLAPREIAAASGVPLATVKSRLQRGLGLLREKLGEREGTDWRAGLVAAFGWQEGVVGSGTAAATMWPGVLLMTAWMKSAAAVLVVVGAGFLWWSLREQAAPVPVVVVDAGKEASAVSASLGARLQEGASTSTPPVVERTAVEPGVAANPKNATLRGRCVDEHGVALAGCAVSLTGVVADKDRLDAWLEEHQIPPAWQDPAVQTTAADGAFSFAFAPPTPFRFSLRIRAQQFVGVNGDWQRLADEEVVDLGDIVMRHGIAVTCRVEDEQGHPRASARISVQNPLLGSSLLLRPQNFVSGQTDAEGRVSLDEALSAGTYMVTVADCEVVRPMLLTLTPESAAQVATVVVRPAPEMVKIVGTVVDDAGQPIAGAWVEAMDLRMVFPGISDRLGKFELKIRRDMARDGVQLAVRSRLREPLSPEQAVDWGTHGIVLQMQRGAELSVRLCDASGAPIERYAVRVLPLSSRSGQSGDTDVQARGPFVNGTATLPSVPIGRWLVWLEPPTGAVLPMVVAPIEILDHASKRIELRLARATRQLRLVDRSGAAVVGSKVRVVDAMGAEMGAFTQVAPAERFQRMTTSSTALLLEELTTDENGRASLQGQADRPLTLMIDGPGHPPKVQSGVSLTEGGELRVVVDRGGSVRGRVTPPEALTELRRLAGLPLEGAIPSAREQNLATVSVFGIGALQQRKALPIDAEGMFAGSGIVAGTFDLGVNIQHGQGYMFVRGAPIEIREGEVTEVVLDLTAMLPGVLSGTVTWNGAPLANENVRLDSASPVGRERPDFAQYAAWTDAQGHFELRCLPGSYTLSMSRPGRGNTLSLRTMAEAVVVRDQTTHHTFAIESGKIELTLLDAEGRPAMVGQVMANAENPPRGHQLARVDATGPFQADLEPGEYDLFVLPAGEAITRRMQAAPKGVPFDVNELMRKLRVQIGHASVVAGQTTTLELRLPAAARK